MSPIGLRLHRIMVTITITDRIVNLLCGAQKR